jgi:hypothetical protein
MADWVDDEHLRGDEHTHAIARMPDELAQQRAMAVFTYAKEGFGYDDFTCDNCSRRFVCKLVFDGYNTQGDCLWEK